MTEIDGATCRMVRKLHNCTFRSQETIERERTFSATLFSNKSVTFGQIIIETDEGKGVQVRDPSEFSFTHRRQSAPPLVSSTRDAKPVSRQSTFLERPKLIRTFCALIDWSMDHEMHMHFITLL